MKNALIIGVVSFFLFLFLGIISRHLRKSWLAPGPFFALYWCIAASAPLLFSPFQNVSKGALSWIFFSTIGVVSGDLIKAFRKKNNQMTTTNIKFSNDQIAFIAFLAIFCTSIGIISFGIILKSAAQSMNDLSSIQDILVVLRKIESSKYSYEYKPQISQILNTFLYTATLFGGLLAAIGHSRRHLIFSFLSILPALLMTAISTLRGFFIISIVMWISSYLATGVLLGNYKLFTKRRIFLSFITGGLIVIVGIGAGIARNFANAYANFAVCALAHMEVFSNWFDKGGLKFSKPMFGAYTFSGIFDKLGLHDRYYGLYAESVTLSNGDASNIYTLFRGLIEDFTPVGSISILFLFSLLSSHAYQRLLQGKIKTMPILASFYATVLWSFSCSIWIWNSIIAAFIVYYIGYLIMIDLHKFRFMQKVSLLFKSGFRQAN